MERTRVSLRSQIRVVLAMSADGKIADGQRSAARFGSPADQRHLVHQVAEVDAVMFGAATLRAYGTTLVVRDPHLLAQRHQRHQPDQPIHMVCSASGQVNPQARFFQQAVPRWLLTTTAGADHWQSLEADPHTFNRIVIVPEQQGVWDWQALSQMWYAEGLTQVAALGGGTLVADLFQAQVVDALYLTVCPLVLGGHQAPTPVDGLGWSADRAPRLQLVGVNPVEDEVFLQYRVL